MTADRPIPTDAHPRTLTVRRRLAALHAGWPTAIACALALAPTVAAGPPITSAEEPRRPSANGVAATHDQAPVDDCPERAARV